jgi:hypothetical protein
MDRVLRKTRLSTALIEPKMNGGARSLSANSLPDEGARAALGPPLRKTSMPDVMPPQRQAIQAFADRGGRNRLARLWDELFPLILPPERVDGLGGAILNSSL